MISVNSLFANSELCELLIKGIVKENLSPLHLEILKSSFEAATEGVSLSNNLPRKKYSFSFSEDSIVPSLLHIEGAVPDTIVNHELRTARDYAIFLSRHAEERFVLISEFDGKSVPFLDGVLINKSGKPVVNVSLKYASIKMPRISKELILHSLSGRLNHAPDLDRIKNPLEWFRKVNHLERVKISKKLKGKKERLVENSINLAKIFNFITPEGFNLLNNELRVILDMRDHGYPYSFFEDPELQKEIIFLVKNSPQVSLTLLWNQKEVIEFTDEKAIVY